MIKNNFLTLAVFAFVSSFLILIGGMVSDEAHAAIYVKIPGLEGDVTTEGYEGYFVADSFSFGVEREMKESGEKGGTEDINIGVGELQECTISKSLDIASATLAQAAINGNSLGTTEIEFVEVGGNGEAATYLKYKLDRVFVKSWSTSGDADDRPTEEVVILFTGLEKSPSSDDDVKSESKEKDDSSSKDSESNREQKQDESMIVPGQRVPSWVQSTAKFWVDKDVSDREFTDALGFLVKEKIIDVNVEPQEENKQEDPSTLMTEKEESKVPEWIGQTTKWWIEGQVPEDQFLEGIKWMIKNKIIRGVS